MALGTPFPCDDLSYPFSFLRLQAASFASPGVVSAGDMAVSPSAGLQVQVAAGKAFVQQTVVKAGETAFNKGLYYAFNDAAANPYNTISAPLVNPRVDQVVLRVYDTTEQGLGGSSFQRFEWIPGAETAGANVTPGSGGYLAGVAALPANSLLLAYVLQTVGEVSISSGNILNQSIRAGLWLPGAWAAITPVGSIIAAPGFYPPTARIEGDIVRLRGAIKNNSGSSTTGNAASMPSGTAPALAVVLSTVDDSGNSVTVEVSSLILEFPHSVAAGAIVNLNSLTYPLS